MALRRPDAERLVRTSGGDVVSIGPLRPGEPEQLFSIFDEVVSSGDGFPQAPPLTWEVFEATWLHTTIAVGARRRDGAELYGAYYMKANFAARAAHIANAGYVVARLRRGRGIGRALVEDSVQRAPAAGFGALQFNLVFEANPARRLYEALGFEPIGRIPKAVDGADAFIYWREVP
ncbi:MAG: GNAT family N-acetyltransferase [Acidimicrobiales bacterium]